MDLKQNLETLVSQYKEVAEQAAQAVTMKTKLEGAIEYTQGLLAEEKKAAEEEAPKGKGKSSK